MKPTGTWVNVLDLFLEARGRRWHGASTKGAQDMRLTILAGERFGRLTVEDRAITKNSRTMWCCRCDCGTTKAIDGRYLVSGAVVSCGCYSRERKVARQTKHGDTPWGKPNAAEYRIWRHIKSRCLNTNVKGYKDYGGRGITICDEWRDSYAAFLHHMGRRPTNRHSINRVDNNKGYEPGNCEWATAVIQSRNRRSVSLTMEAATFIRTSAAMGVPRKDLQAQFGVSKPTIGNIIRNKVWRPDHV